MNGIQTEHPAALVDLAGKVALITGAASGIGRAQVDLFMAAGAHVVAVDIDRHGLERISTAGSRAGRLLCVNANLTVIDDIHRVVASAIAAFENIDILCNTAGVLDDFMESLETDEARWDRVFNVNVKSLYRITNEVLPHMIQRQAGVIVNMASIAGLKAGAGGAAYTSSKHAVLGFTRQLSSDYGRFGIRVNAICPGMIDTAMTRAVLDDEDSSRVRALKRVPAGRLGRPEDIARVALFLCGPGADFIHGASIVVDGGLTVR
ncbi:glucose 1-dehydrogenase [Burkholderia sp. Ac-20345]|uniref:SDR family NAD(P)-dependent oxidoreductase n=1 Tax=Burkholderia sp. Ac-20345 TaxID=2703891 RepID=UPI00068B3F5D|nr:glucose 1-dehydrogenase [Burkholderia sp. Ac-20345]MBN3778046.1 glucose 1-dehydrogenase [Burkholderia sp. Ac-20345]